MIITALGYAVVKTAVDGVKGWKTQMTNLGSETSITFKRDEVEVRFFLSIEGDRVTYKVFRNEIPVTKERELLSKEEVRDILASYEGGKE